MAGGVPMEEVHEEEINSGDQIALALTPWVVHRTTVGAKHGGVKAGRTFCVDVLALRSYSTNHSEPPSRGDAIIPPLSRRGAVKHAENSLAIDHKNLECCVLPFPVSM